MLYVAQRCEVECYGFSQHSTISIPLGLPHRVCRTCAVRAPPPHAHAGALFSQGLQPSIQERALFFHSHFRQNTTGCQYTDEILVQVKVHNRGIQMNLAQARVSLYMRLSTSPVRKSREGCTFPITRHTVTQTSIQRGALFK